MTLANMRKGDTLRAVIGEYLSGSLPLPQFWSSFTFGYADAPGGELSDREEEFFAEVNDELHHTDFDSPADPSLRDATEFRAWLTEAYGRFQAVG